MFIRYYSMVLFIISYGRPALSHNHDEFIPPCIMDNFRFLSNTQINLDNVENIMGFLSPHISSIPNLPTHIYINWQLVFISHLFILAKDGKSIIFNSTMNNKIRLKLWNELLNKTDEYNLNIFFGDYIPFFNNNSKGLWIKMANTQLLNTNNQWFWIFQGCSQKLNVSYAHFNDFQNKGVNIVLTTVNKSKNFCEPCQLLNCLLDSNMNMKSDFNSFTLLSLQDRFEIDWIIKSDSRFPQPSPEISPIPSQYIPYQLPLENNISLISTHKIQWIEMLICLMFFLLLIYVICYFCVIIKIGKYLK